MIFRIDQQHFDTLLAKARVKTCRHAMLSRDGSCGREVVAFWMVKPTKKGQTHIKARAIGVCSTHDKVMWRQKEREQEEKAL